MLTKTRVEKQIGVYNPGTDFRSPPDRFIDESEARRLKNNGDAVSVNHGKSIRMTRLTAGGPEEPFTALRGLSSRPDEELIERYAMASNSGRDMAAVIAIEAWTGPVTGSKGGA